jgi:dTDP-glucose pyrophosphorylase
MSSNDEWLNTILPPTATIEDAIQVLNETGLRIVLVANKDSILLGTISDGDIRRALLRGLLLSNSIEAILNSSPIVIEYGISQESVLTLMSERKIQQIPIVDQQGKLLGLHLWDEISRTPKKSNLMVIMAGGMGTRLYPQTENCPKPMLTISGKPILEHIISRAKNEGFSDFVVAVYHLRHVVEDYFGNGEKFGVSITYLKEESPLGTAGALGLLDKKPDSPFIVTNGDVITDIRYGDFLSFHNSHKMPATMAVRLNEWQNPFGVVDVLNSEVVGYEEKPITHNYINAGIYAFNPEILNLFEKSKKVDMSTFLQQLMKNGSQIAAFPIHEPWLDIGRPSDFLEAVNKLTEKK